MNYRRKFITNPNEQMIETFKMIIFEFDTTDLIKDF